MKLTGILEETASPEMVDVIEMMLLNRAMRGIRPLLYISSYIDLDCSMLMLLNEPDIFESEWGVGAPRSRGFYTLVS